MDRTRRSKPQHTTWKESNACKTAHDVEGNSTDENKFLERLSQVLDNRAFNEHLIRFRRKICFSYEHEMTLRLKAFGCNRRIYIFGSQIEGTTTLGMMSDFDIVHRFDTFRLFLDSEHPPLPQHDQQVVIKVSTNPCSSQYCLLTMIEPSTQAIHFKKLYPYRGPIDIVKLFRVDWTKSDGMIPHTIMFVLAQLNLEIFRQSKRHGPAESRANTDSVYACYCKSLPKQCKFVFKRPHPGHWPSEMTLKKAKKYGVFIVPQGPAKSTNICTNDNFDYQWRISTNLTERLFMFSLDTVHLKAYVLTKMIRKELFASEYRDRLSTFHFKTAFFFAIENTRPDVWREDNLINCVKYILTTLRRFLTRRNCPHFTIENVNLFDGKIERHEFPKLVDKVTDVINALRTNIENIQMDNIGISLNERSRYHSHGSALVQYVLNTFHGVRHSTEGIDCSELSVNERITVFENEFSLLETYSRATLDKYRKYDYALHSNMSGTASLGASAYLGQMADGREYNYDGINKARQMYKQSLESDIIVNYVKYASFLFCNREYDEACKYFDLIEKKIEEDKTSYLIYLFCVFPSESLALQIALQSCEQSAKQRMSLFCSFRQAEKMCVPEFLWCEMYRGRFGADTSSERLSAFFNHEERICVQIEPYLHYLQYLTYKKLNQEPKQSEALMKLSIFTESIKPKRVIASTGNIYTSFAYCDTSLNMLGHCLELEQKFESAWKTYTTSLQMVPQRNAAVLHIIRLLWQVIQSLQRSEVAEA